MNKFDTYLPSELKKKMQDLHLEGRKITAIQSPSGIYFFDKDNDPTKEDYSPEQVSTDIDDEIILSLDDGRHVGFHTSAGSHIFIMSYTEDEIPKSNEQAPISVSMMFRFLIGKTIFGFNVVTTDSPYSFAYIDTGFDVNQKIYIDSLEILFGDNSKIIFKPDYDAFGIEYTKG